VLFVQDSNEKCDNAICKISEGDKSALSVIYSEYGRMIYSIAYEIVKSPLEAEDVLQDVMVKILDYAYTYKSGTNPKAWIMTIVRNTAFTKLRNKVHTVSIDELDDNLLSEKCILPDNNNEILLLKKA